LATVRIANLSSAVLFASSDDGSIAGVLRIRIGKPMIPRLDALSMPDSVYRDFIVELHARGFQGDLSIVSADRIVIATDNSVYQVAPQGIAFPKTKEDLTRIARLAVEPRFQTVVFRPRGGGTGTNGQSLGDGLVIDVSRHMNRILEINLAEGWVRVEPGVVKDQLDAALSPLGYFFPPELSTSNRATLGGMISTDACGQGSCLYGKTRNYVLELTTVLLDGVLWTSRAIDDVELDAIQRRDDRVGAIHRLVDGIQRKNAALIERVFPKLNRCLTGYDLAHIRDEAGRFNLNSVLCGSEGTLALIAEAKLKVIPRPQGSVLLNIRYGSFDAALRDAGLLMKLGPASIETIDSKVLELARDDSIWSEVRDYFPDDPVGRSLGINIVEFVSDRPEEAEEDAARAVELIKSVDKGIARLGFTVARQDAVGRIWEMRKRAVGLLGHVQGRSRPVPFVEDTAVPPEQLANYIVEFRALLDRRGLDYGMFGHVDAGVLHVRPCLNLNDPTQDHLIREVTEEVVALTLKYGGLLWGEHGKGVRSEFVPEVFGPLYPSLVAIKKVFDPDDQFNPGKIASAAARPLMRVDGVPLRGSYDRVIPQAVRDAYDEAMHCNGNGACYDWNPDDAMCPSWKGTRERRHSPKGRAALLREWLRLLTVAGVDPVEESRRARRASTLTGLFRSLRRAVFALPQGEDDFSHDVKDAMDGCLACKACVGQCPIKVDVPTFRSKFLELYHDRYARPLKDYLLFSLEPMTPLLARVSGLYNFALASRAGRAAMRQLGLVHSPPLAGLSLRHELARRGVRFASADELNVLNPSERARSVVLVQDAFTSYFETSLFLDFVDLVRTLGFTPWVAPFRANGKALHMIGMLGPFARAAHRNASALSSLSDSGVALVGLDPSMTLTYRSEYKQALGAAAAPRVLLVQEWLASLVDQFPQGKKTGRKFSLLPHCTERTMAGVSLNDWRKVFDGLGLELEILAAGCCGMAGVYGHDASHRETSERIYRLSWATHLSSETPTDQLMATGYSCRSQVRLMSDVKLPHPIQVLLRHLGKNTDGPSFAASQLEQYSAEQSSNRQTRAQTNQMEE
jgi:(R)-2-hydroxyglutarate dehydrogenase